MFLLTSPKVVCQKYQIKPLRKRGQNFLINDVVIEKVLKAADLNKKDNVLEIGPGLGALTKELAQKAQKIVAVEIDKKLVEVLKKELKDYQNVKIVQEDIRKIEPLNYNLKSYKIVANLPFNITGLVLKKFLSCSVKPSLMVLILQKEVGERIVAQPGQMSKLSVMTQFYARVKVISNIKKDNFWPKPKVDSVILKIKPFSSSLFQNKDLFFEIVRAGFLSPRKYLLNNLDKNAMINKEEAERIFKRIGLNKKVRAQELSVKDWVNLVQQIGKENKI